MPNIAFIKSLHRNHILNSNNTEYRCNCSSRDEYLLENEYLTPRIVYRPDGTNNKTDEYKYYYGISDTSSFKELYENHKTSSDIDHILPLQMCLSITGN